MQYQARKGGKERELIFNMNKHDTFQSERSLLFCFVKKRSLQEMTDVFAINAQDLPHKIKSRLFAEETERYATLETYHLTLNPTQCSPMSTAASRIP